jgi:hypothetical protein
MICCGNAGLIHKIARTASVDRQPLGDGQNLFSAAAEGPCRNEAQAPPFRVEVHRTLPPVLAKLRRQGFEIVALEQATGAASLMDFRFQRRTVLVVGNERTGVEEEVLRFVDHAVEIPVFGLPLAHNAATAAVMALYEYCRQYPRG